jgi:KDO2-lipid IV(A) lauroyltransferase
MTQALNDSLAARIRQTPEQWFWMHRRWKPERVTRRLGRGPSGASKVEG